MADAGFDEVRFPTNIDFGLRGGPEFFTTIITTPGGQEQRNQNWEEQRMRFTAAHNLKDQTDYDVILTFFHARKGRARGFRFKDWTDFCSDMPGYRTNISESAHEDELPAQGDITPQPMGRVGDLTSITGDGATTTFQMMKTYTSGGSSQIRPVTKFVYGGVVARQPRIFVGAVLYTEGGGGTGYSIDTTDFDGIVTFNVAPAAGLAVTADFLYDVPVRFDTDRMEGTIVHFNTHSWTGIDVVEVRV